MPSRAALMRLTAGTRNRRWDSHLNEEPLVPELVLELCRPWYAGIVNPFSSGRQGESETASKSKAATEV
jgi:hypothetical protein